MLIRYKTVMARRDAEGRPSSLPLRPESAAEGQVTRFTGPMGKVSRRPNRRGRERRRPLEDAGPTVHVKIAHAASHLDAVTSLAKASVLYADKVTVYSPVASMLRSVDELAKLDDPRQQVLTTLSIVQSIPSMSSEINIDEQTLQQFLAFLTIDRRTARRISRTSHDKKLVDKLHSKLDHLAATWAQDMPRVIEKCRRAVGGDELFSALEAGVLEVADVATDSRSQVAAECLRAAQGDPSNGTIDGLVGGLVARIVEMLSEPLVFPLLDAESSHLVRALEEEARLDPSEHALRRSSEITTAATVMGYLPYFVDLPMDEIVDLRRVLRTPLTRFRSAMAELSREFGSRPTDEEFKNEIEDAWRTNIAPALLEIRELLAEHGLLRQTASVALGDPKRIIAEAGGVVIAAASDVVSLSRMLTAAIAAGVPVADLMGRALKNVRDGRQRALTHKFYFLHQLGIEAERRTA